MNIGHICLAASGTEAGERFAALVEALARHEVEQHVLVASIALARRLAGSKQVTVGPIVKTPVMACALMPKIDIAHVHERKSGQAGLLLTLTRSIPFVITTEGGVTDHENPLSRSVLHRAAHVIEKPDSAPGKQAARRHLSVYADVLSA